MQGVNYTGMRCNPYDANGNYIYAVDKVPECRAGPHCTYIPKTRYSGTYECDAGYAFYQKKYQDATDSTQTSAFCFTCDGGAYNPTRGLVKLNTLKEPSCFQCPPHWASKPGSTTCLPCPPGYTSKGGMSSCWSITRSRPAYPEDEWTQVERNDLNHFKALGLWYPPETATVFFKLPPSVFVFGGGFNAGMFLQAPAAHGKGPEDAAALSAASASAPCATSALVWAVAAAAGAAAAVAHGPR